MILIFAYFFNYTPNCLEISFKKLIQKIANGRVPSSKIAGLYVVSPVKKKSRKDHSAIYQLLYSWIMNKFIP